MPVETLRPNGSSGTGVVTGTNAHAATSDDSDSTYVTFTGAQATAFLFDTYALQPGEVAASITPRIRVAAASTPGTYTFNLQAETSGGTTVLHPYGSPYTIGTTPTTVELPTFVASGPAGFSQSQIDGLVMRFKLANPSPTVKNVYELYLDVLVVEAPTVDVIAPTDPVSDTTRPRVTWDFTPSADGGPQAAYQVRVFTAAQYGAVGFDPATSEATWEPGGASGFITSGNQSVQVGIDLLNGVTYRAYVRAAHSLLGGFQWSDWDFIQFDMDLTAPLAPTVTATAVPSEGRVAVTVQQNVAETLSINRWVIERGRSLSGPWEFVRGWSDDTALVGGNGVSASDFEPPVGQQVFYRAKGVNITNDGQEIGGEWGASGPVVYDPTGAWLKDPLWSSRNVAVTLKDNNIPTLTRPRRQGVHEPLGRELPVVVSDVFRAERGTVTFVTFGNPLGDTNDDATDLQDLLLRGRVLLLETPYDWGWGSRYIAVLGDLVEERTGGTAMELSRFWPVEFVVVDRPPDEGFVA